MPGGLDYDKISDLNDFLETLGELHEEAKCGEEGGWGDNFGHSHLAQQMATHVF